MAESKGHFDVADYQCQLNATRRGPKAEISGPIAFGADSAGSGKMIGLLPARAVSDPNS